MTVDSENTGKNNPFKGFARKLGKMFGGNVASNAHSTVEEMVGASSSMISDAQNMQKHKEPSHDTHHHSNSHNPNSHDHQQHGAHGQYQFSPYFERAVELINTAAGIIVMASVLLAGINIILVALNANFSKYLFIHFEVSCILFQFACTPISSFP
jgi:hypothetical protein